MPFGLYGTYYASARDAENAEMAQVAEIDARHAYEKTQKLEQQMYEQQQHAGYESQQKIDFLMKKIEDLEKRIVQLEGNEENTKTKNRRSGRGVLS